jgi:hypothetical protein
MKNYINEIIKKGDPSIEELIKCLELVRENGDVVVVKFDGERTKDQYTLFVTFSKLKNKNMIRVDDSNLKEALVKLLTIYVE